MFLDTFKENETRELIVERITFILREILKKKGNLEDKEKIREKAIQVFWNLNYITIYGLMIHCVCSIGSNELSSVIRSACESRSDAPLLKIIPYVVEIMFKKLVNIDGMKKIFPVLPETVRNMLKFVVVGYCRIHNISFKERQQVEALFNLRNKLLPNHLSSTE